MESKVWSRLIEIQHMFADRFAQTGAEVVEPEMSQFNRPGWVNRVWTSSDYRRAHLDVVDARLSKGLWMMHCCVFPHTHNPAPIFGFDVIAGKNKITGCFIDYSPTSSADHSMTEYFANEVSSYKWNKPRALPLWAELIFSKAMVAAGNVSEDHEIEQIAVLSTTLINHYIEHVGKTNNTIIDTTWAQNFYATQQKQNPHTPKVMVSLGLAQEQVELFINKCLFPTLP